MHEEILDSSLAFAAHGKAGKETNSLLELVRQ
jgi:hypothetical protein